MMSYPEAATAVSTDTGMCAAAWASVLAGPLGDSPDVLALTREAGLAHRAARLEADQAWREWRR